MGKAESEKFSQIQQKKREPICLECCLYVVIRKLSQFPSQSRGERRVCLKLVDSFSERNSSNVVIQETAVSAGGTPDASNECHSKRNDQHHHRRPGRYGRDSGECTSVVSPSRTRSSPGFEASPFWGIRFSSLVRNKRLETGFAKYGRDGWN